MKLIKLIGFILMLPALFAGCLLLVGSIILTSIKKELGKEYDDWDRETKDSVTFFVAFLSICLSLLILGIILYMEWLSI